MMEKLTQGKHGLVIWWTHHLDWKKTWMTKFERICQIKFWLKIWFKLGREWTFTNTLPYKLGINWNRRRQWKHYPIIRTSGQQVAVRAELTADAARSKHTYDCQFLVLVHTPSRAKHHDISLWVRACVCACLHFQYLFWSLCMCVSVCVHVWRRVQVLGLFSHLV